MDRCERGYIYLILIFVFFLNMRKTFIFFASVAIVALSGCSSEEIANMETSVSNAIGFNLVGSNPVTRATPITSSNITDTDFDVFAFTSSTEHDEPFMGTSESDGVKIVYKGNKWDYENPAELAYWPTAELDFYAVNPVSSESPYYGYTINKDKQQIICATFDEFGNDSGEQNLDVMYATAFNQTKNTNSGKVKLEFKHALSQVLFKAKTALDLMEVEVKEIKIHNIKFSGTFTFPKKGELATCDNWNLPPIEKANNFKVRNENWEVKSVKSTTDAVWLSEEKNPMIVHPQKSEKWTPVTPGVDTKFQADTELYTYLSIQCKIKQKGIYIHGSESNYAYIYVPFEADWQPGYRYIYTMIFGGGYDKMGYPILTPIEFEAEASEWKDKELESSFVTSK